MYVCTSYHLPASITVLSLLLLFGGWGWGGRGGGENGVPGHRPVYL